MDCPGQASVADNSDGAMVLSVMGERTRQQLGRPCALTGTSANVAEGYGASTRKERGKQKGNLQGQQDGGE